MSELLHTFGERGRVEGRGGGRGRGAGEGHQPDVVSGDGDSDVSPSLSPSQETRIPKNKVCNIVTDQANFCAEQDGAESGESAEGSEEAAEGAAEAAEEAGRPGEGTERARCMLIVSCVEFIPFQLPTTVSFKVCPNQ